MNNIRFFSVILYGKLLKNKTYEVHLHCMRIHLRPRNWAIRKVVLNQVQPSKTFQMIGYVRSVG